MKIESITLNIKGQKIEVTPDEARALFAELRELLGEKPPPVVYPIYTTPWLPKTICDTSNQ